MCPWQLTDNFHLSPKMFPARRTPLKLTDKNHTQKENQERALLYFNFVLTRAWDFFVSQTNYLSLLMTEENEGGVFICMTSKNLRV